VIVDLHAAGVDAHPSVGVDNGGHTVVDDSGPPSSVLRARLGVDEELDDSWRKPARIDRVVARSRVDVEPVDGIGKGDCDVCGKVVSLLSTALSLADTQLARLRNLSLCYELMLTPQVMKLHAERVRQRKLLEQGAQLVEAGKLNVLVSHKLPLAEAAQAHRLIEQGGVVGKIVLTMD